MAIFSDPSIPELVLFDAGEASLLDAEDIVLLDAGDFWLWETEIEAQKTDEIDARKKQQNWGTKE